MLTSTYILLYIRSFTHTTTMNAIKSDFSGGFARYTHSFCVVPRVVKLLTRRPKRPLRRRFKIFHHHPPRVHDTTHRRFKKITRPIQNLNYFISAVNTDLTAAGH